MKKPTRDKNSSFFNNRVTKEKKFFFNFETWTAAKEWKSKPESKKFEKNHHLQEDVFVRVFYIYSLLWPKTVIYFENNSELLLMYTYIG